MADKQKLISTAELARVLGKSSRTIQDLAQQGHLTAVKNGTRYSFDLYICVQEYIEYLREKEAKPTSSNELTIQKMKEDIRFKKAKADMMEMNLAELEGRMHAAEDVEAMTIDLILAVRSSLLALPGRLGVEVAEISDKLQCSDVIKKCVCEILDDLSRYEYNPEEYKKRVRDRQGWSEAYEEETE